MDDDNVFQFGSVKGGKEDSNELPLNEYRITDIDGHELYATGFLIFTPHHVAVMRDFGQGAVPLLLVPLARVVAAEADDDEADIL